MRHYATAPREREFGPLVASMDRHCSPYTLHVLCWDWWPAKRPPPHITCISREAFLQARPEYAPEYLPGPPRSVIDTVATVRWRWYLDVMDRAGEPLTCIDGDIHWFSSPEPLFTEIPATAPLAVSHHRIPARASGLPGVCRETHAQYGEFNSGFSIWRDPAALRDMCARTFRWSYTEVRPHPVDGRPDFGDQGAIERVARRHGAHVIQHPGVNVAPWNCHAHAIERTPDGWTVDGKPLILYHFSSLNGHQNANAAYEVSRHRDWRALADIYGAYRNALGAGALPVSAAR